MSHPSEGQRRFIRLKGYDYSQPGGYYVTICTRDRILLFENNNIKEIGEEYWRRIPNHFPHVELDQWVIMPNHLHGIIIIHDSCRGVQLNAPTMPSRKKNYRSNLSIPVNNTFMRISPLKGSLAVIIRTYKASVTRECHRTGHNDFGWQRGYYDRIIRNEKELDRIRRYIQENPLKWQLDPYHPTRR